MKKFFALLVLAGLANLAAAADVVGNAKAAENKVAMCIGCHGIAGYKATFPEVYQVPMLGGQSASYLVAALIAWIVRDYSTQRRTLGDLEDRGVTRRSQRASKDEG